MDAQTEQLNRPVHGIHIVLFFAFFLFCIQIDAQQINLEKKISIISRGKPLHEILKEIEQKGSISFSFSHQQINANQNLSIIARNKKISDILTELFQETDIDFMVVEKQIILKQKKVAVESKKEIDIPLKKYSINGFLKDAQTGEILIGAAVAVKNHSIGTFTNSYGFFSLTLPSGLYDIEFSYLGYRTMKKNVTLDKDIQLVQNLVYDENKIDIIIITANENKDIHSLNPLKKISFSPISMSSKVGISGETDLMQVLQSIPGIQTQSDGSVFFFTRGGNKDQNLILIDDAPIYNPSHLFGYFSIISPDAINEISIYKNQFPMQFGGRLSSVVDIRTKDGNINNFGMSGNINPFTTSLSFEGPIVKEKASWFMGLRTSTINWLSNVNPNYQKVNFIDFHTKLNYKINHKNRLLFSFYSGNDQIQYIETAYSTFAIKWQNFASTLRWNHLFSEKLFSNLMVYASLYDYYLYTSIENDQYWNSMIGNLSFKADMSYFLNTRNTLRFGFALNNHYFNPGNFNDEYLSRKVSASGVIESVLYFGHECRLHENLSLNYGIRFTGWNNVGPAISYSYNNDYEVTDTLNFGNGIYNTYRNLEPGIDILYSINKSSSIKFNFSHHVQNLHLLSNSISPFTTLDIWMPSDPYIKPQSLNQTVLAFQKSFLEFEIAVEAYYKKMFNQIEYTEHANMLLNSNILGELRFGNSTSKGIELMIRKVKGDITGTMLYSYSDILNDFKDINGGKSFAPYHEKPHQFVFNASAHFNTRWLIHLNWTWSTGSRFSAPSGFYTINGYSVPLYSEKNNSRLPAYHRLDISSTLRLNKNYKAKYSHHLVFTIINAYARKNPISINFNKQMTEEGKFVVTSNYLTENQLLPTSIYLFGIVPTITYKFGFQNIK